MDLAINGLSALKIIRTLRQEKTVDISKLPRVNLRPPRPGENGRWSRASVASFLEPYGCVSDFSNEAPLGVAVPTAKERLRFKGSKNTVYTYGLPDGAFLDMGGGLLVSSPELLFLELASSMSLEVQLLCGMELCGTFSRNAEAPRNGSVVYRINPATNADRVRSFVERCRRVDGINQTREALEWLLDNAWSPMEAVVAEVAVLPVGLFGYDMWPIDLNPREDMGSGAIKAERVPDIMFRGTDVGLNYDGEGHLPVGDVVDAAIRAAANPGEASMQKELDEAVGRVRSNAVSDKRRDRDLASPGKTVMAMTKEDLNERGGLDRLMLQVINTIERKGARQLKWQRKALESKLLCDLRQELIWSLLPGTFGAEHAATFAEVMRINPDPVGSVRKASFKDGTWKVEQIKLKDGTQMAGEA